MEKPKHKEPSRWQRLNSLKTLAELFQVLPEKSPAVTSCSLMSLLAVLPALATLVFSRGGEITDWYHWLFMMMKIIGNLGLLFAVFMFFWRRYRKGNRTVSLWVYVKLNGLWIFLLAMLGWSILSTLFSTNPTLSFAGDSYRKDGLESYLAYAGIFALALQLREQKHVMLVLNLFAGSAALLAFVGWLNHPQVNETFQITPEKSIFCNSNHYGYYICMSIMAAVLLFAADRLVARRKWLVRGLLLLHGLELALLAHALIQSQTLGALLAVALALIALIVLAFWVNRKRAWLVVLATLIVIGSAAISNNAWNFSSESSRLFADFSVISETIAGEAVDQDAINRVGSGRGKLLISAVSFIAERPVFGYGPDNLGARYREAGVLNNDRPHNEIIQFAASLGIPAALFYLLALFFHLRLFITNFKRLDMAVLCAYGIVGAYLISSLFGNTLYYTSPFYFMLLGISGALMRPLANKREVVPAEA